jgi:hypothetical protein
MFNSGYQNFVKIEIEFEILLMFTNDQNRFMGLKTRVHVPTTINGVDKATPDKENIKRKVKSLSEYK